MKKRDRFGDLGMCGRRKRNSILDNKIISGYKHNNVIYFIVYLGHMFRSIDHHQAIFTKLMIRCMQF